VITSTQAATIVDWMMMPGGPAHTVLIPRLSISVRCSYNYPMNTLFRWANHMIVDDVTANYNGHIDCFGYDGECLTGMYNDGC
jgi:hypothetical protein